MLRLRHPGTTMRRGIFFETQSKCWRHMSAVALCVAGLLCLLVNRTDGQLSGGEYMALVQRVCPDTTFCQEYQRIQQGRITTPCCAECSCDPTCHVIGNCCPDAPPVPFSGHEGHCTTIAHHLNERRNVSVPRLKTKHIRVITECPAGLGSQHDVTRCHTPMHLEDFQLVSNPVSRRIYTNKHCATCHGDSSVIPWTLSVYNCSDLLKKKHMFKSFEERDQYVLNHCSLLAFPVDSYVSKNDACFNDAVYGTDVIRDCKIPIDKVPVDYDIRAACLYSTDQGKGLLVYNNGTVYANPFCFLCNADAMASTAQCDKYGVEDLLHPASLIPLEVRPTGPDKSTCKRNQLLDIHSGVCMEVFCPAGTVPNYGDCVYPLQGGDYLSLEVFFVVVFGVDIQPERFVLHASVLLRVETKVNQLLEGHCGTCDTHLYKSSSDRHYYLQIVLQTQETCEGYKLIKVLHELFDNGFNSRLVISGRELVVRIQPMDLIADNITDLKLVSMEANVATCLAPKTYNRDLPLVCPIVRVSLEQLRNSGIAEDAISALANSTYEQGLTEQVIHKLDICVKDFTSLNVSSARLGQLNGEMVFNTAWSHFLCSTFICRCFSMLALVLMCEM